MNAKQMLTTVSRDPRFATMFMQTKENISVLISLEPNQFRVNLPMLAQLATAVLWQIRLLIIPVLITTSVVIILILVPFTNHVTIFPGLSNVSVSLIPTMFVPHSIPVPATQMATQNVSLCIIRTSVSIKMSVKTELIRVNKEITVSMFPVHSFAKQLVTLIHTVFAPQTSVKPIQFG